MTRSPALLLAAVWALLGQTLNIGKARVSECGTGFRLEASVFSLYDDSRDVWFPNFPLALGTAGSTSILWEGPPVLLLLAAGLVRINARLSRSASAAAQAAARRTAAARRQSEIQAEDLRILGNMDSQLGKAAAEANRLRIAYLQLSALAVSAEAAEGAKAAIGAALANFSTKLPECKRARDLTAAARDVMAQATACLASLDAQAQHRKPLPAPAWTTQIKDAEAFAVRFAGFEERREALARREAEALHWGRPGAELASNPTSPPLAETSLGLATPPILEPPSETRLATSNPETSSDIALKNALNPFANRYAPVFLQRLPAHWWDSPLKRAAHESGSRGYLARLANAHKRMVESLASHDVRVAIRCLRFHSAPDQTWETVEVDVQSAAPIEDGGALVSNQAVEVLLCVEEAASGTVLAFVPLGSLRIGRRSPMRKLIDGSSKNLTVKRIVQPARLKRGGNAQCEFLEPMIVED